ncbi:MAG: inorganic diphosphatase [Candidatus Eremiobacteraeota bacterium]|nr:inorganic diphosphatase [Candidatus Eremiobacteraeota bacterium]
MSARKSVNPTHYEKIETFIKGEKHAVNGVIETPRNQRHKYAFVPDLGIFEVKLILSEGLVWPYDYGFIPRTLGDDGDSLDLLYLGDEPTFTGCLVHARVIGIVSLKKNGTENDRILTCPMRQKGVFQDSDPFDDIDDVPKEIIENICRYLVEYSESEGNKIEFRGTQSRKHAIDAIERGEKRYKKQQSG